MKSGGDTAACLSHTAALPSLCKPPPVAKRMKYKPPLFFYTQPAGKEGRVDGHVWLQRGGGSREGGALV